MDAYLVEGSRKMLQVWQLHLPDILPLLFQVVEQFLQVTAVGIQRIG